MRECDLAIIGAGAAGLSAATAAAEHGLTVTVFDDNAQTGGQYFRRLPPGYRRTKATVFDKDQARAEALYRGADHPGITMLTGAVVWEAPEDNVLAFARGADSGNLRAKLIAVAAGAHDRPVPFPGWTLPGVVTAGGLQNLIKGQRVIPGRRAVVAGNGPLVLLVAANLARAGAELIEVAEVAPILSRVWREALSLLAAPKIVRQAIDYRSAIRRSGAPLRTGWTVIEARGEDELAEVVIAPIDGRGRIDRRRSRGVKADLLVTGFGLTPSIELLRAMACRLEWNALRGGWLPVRSAEFETSRQGVFAIGDGAGIGGVEIALREGRLMGLIAAERLGRLPAAAAAGKKRPLQGELARLGRFRAALERLYAPPADYLDLLTPETIVCRCEDVTAGDLRERQGQGFASAAALKSTTRMTMGRCQGRNCLRTLTTLIAQATDQPIESVALPRGRTPVRPVLLGDLIQEALPPIKIPADPHLPRGEKIS
jgi:NADPH-dependent 2,4-dienoyl-CoA reductase/sulfur reductase-like enzyme